MKNHIVSRILEIELIVRACKRRGINPEVTRDEDGFFSIDFNNGTTGFYANLKHALTFIRRNWSL
jgi:hypothetical protein